MSDFSTFIAEQTALGKMAQSVVVKSINGTSVLFYVVPGGSDDSGRDIDTINVGFLDENGEFDSIARSAGVADGTPLNVVLTAGGPVVQYLSAYNDDVNQIRLQDEQTPGFNPVEVQFISPVDVFSTPTVNPGRVIIGEESDDVLIGTGLDDFLVGNGGDDILDGLGGDDVLKGGHGSDRLFGNGNNDSLFGGVGIDELYGGAGHDLLDGGSGADVMYGGFSGDVLFGGRSNDVLFGGNGIDELRGGTGNDALYGGNGSDVLRGNKGHDMLDGGKSNDRMYGDNGNDSLFGGDGNDDIHGGAGHDTIVGGGDADRLQGGAGRDVFVFASGDGSDRITDFKADHDRIDLTAMGLTFEDIGLKQKDQDAILTAGNVQIRLEGFDVTDLEASDFLF